MMQPDGPDLGSYLKKIINHQGIKLNLTTAICLVGFGILIGLAWSEWWPPLRDPADCDAALRPLR